MKQTGFLAKTIFERHLTFLEIFIVGNLLFFNFLVVSKQTFNSTKQEYRELRKCSYYTVESTVCSDVSQIL